MLRPGSLAKNFESIVKVPGKGKRVRNIPGDPSSAGGGLRMTGFVGLAAYARPTFDAAI